VYQRGKCSLFVGKVVARFGIEVESGVRGFTMDLTTSEQSGLRLMSISRKERRVFLSVSTRNTLLSWILFKRSRNTDGLPGLWVKMISVSSAYRNQHRDLCVAAPELFFSKYYLKKMAVAEN
jgi:hypothetical protein